MKNMKLTAMAALTAALVAGSGFAAFAANQGSGQWCNGSDTKAPNTIWQNAEGKMVSSWWFAVSDDGKESLADTWHWIKGTDGKMYCYYFDKDGWMVVNDGIGMAGTEKVDGNGRYLENGVPAEGNEDKVYYTASETFLTTRGDAAAEDKGQAAEQKPETADGKTHSSSGVEPDSQAVGFAVSAVSGTSSKNVVNNWANFSMTLTGFSNVESGDGNSNMDFLALNDEGEISIQYYPLDYYTAGNTDFNSFVQSYLTNKKPGAIEDGVKSAVVAGAKQLGDYTFTQIDRSYMIPINQTIIYSTYLRPVEGTNYVMELYTKNSPDSFAGVLGTMKRVR